MNSDQMDISAPAYVSWIMGTITIYTFLAVFSTWGRWTTSPNIPFIDTREGWEIRYTKAAQRFVSNGAALVQATEAKFKVFHILTEMGPKMILSGRRYADELRNDHRLSHGKFLEQDMHTTIPGFQPFSNGRRHGRITNDIVGKLTRSLPLVTRPLTEEASLALEAQWSQKSEWNEIMLQFTIVKMIAQLSSRVFIGEAMCRNPTWLQLMVDYSGKDVVAVLDLHKWPLWTHGFIHWFMPACRTLRRRLEECRVMLKPFIEKRRKQRATLFKEGKSLEGDFNLLDYIEESANQGESYDATISLISFHFAALPTTSDLLGKVLLDLCQHPELVDALRKEVISAIQEDGWEKTSLYKLKLLDSVMKETQRLRPVSKVLMRRVAMEDMELKDGTEIPKGTTVALTVHHMWSEEVYPDAGTYDGYRFLRMRETPGLENKAHLVSTSPDHMGFGHGKHACPGRFFATSMAKILLCHILLKYDWKLVDDGMDSILARGLASMVSPTVKLAVKTRQPEIEL